MLGPADLTSVAFAPGSVPAGADAAPQGRTLAAPLRAGEPVTDVRLVGPALTDGYPGLTAVPVRLPDAGMAALLAVGDRIDLVSADPQARRRARGRGRPAGAGAAGRRTATSAAPAWPGGWSSSAPRPADVARIADASARTFLSVALGGGPD